MCIMRTMLLRDLNHTVHTSPATWRLRWSSCIECVKQQILAPTDARRQLEYMPDLHSCNGPLACGYFVLDRRQ